MSTQSHNLGLGSFEISKPDSYSRHQARANFLSVVDSLEPAVALTLYEQAFFLFVLLASSQFREVVSSPIHDWFEDEGLRNELNRLLGNFYAVPFEADTKSIHPGLNLKRRTLLTKLLLPFRGLEDLIATRFDGWASIRQIEHPEDAADVSHNNHAKLLRDAITNWSRAWNLDSDWCRDWALAAMCHWLSDRVALWDGSRIRFQPALTECRSRDTWRMTIEPILEDRDDFEKVLCLLKMISAGPEFQFIWRDIDFRTAHWNPILNQRAHWANASERNFRFQLAKLQKNGEAVPRRCLTKFQAARDSYLQKMERGAKELGLTKTPRRWAREHLYWTSLFQVLGLPMSTIEKRYVKSHQTVSDGINRTLHFIDLPHRRNLRPGMPKGTCLTKERRMA